MQAVKWPEPQRFPCDEGPESSAGSYGTSHAGAALQRTNTLPSGAAPEFGGETLNPKS